MRSRLAVILACSTTGTVRRASCRHERVAVTRSVDRSDETVQVPARTRHPKKDVEQALRFAEEYGWTVTPTASGHRWGEMVCTDDGRDACRVSIWSTPKNPGNHANRLRQRVRNCPHELPPGSG